MAHIASRVYIILFFVLFVISTVILILASTARNPIPAWGGYLDVGIVVLIVFTGFTIHQRNKDVPSYPLSYQIAVSLFPLILVAIWLKRTSLDFNILLPGVAWRTYFFLSILPHAIQLWQSEPSP